MVSRAASTASRSAWLSDALTRFSAIVFSSVSARERGGGACGGRGVRARVAYEKPAGARPAGGDEPLEGRKNMPAARVCQPKYRRGLGGPGEAHSPVGEARAHEVE